MGIKVLGARLVVIEDKLDKETENGIIIPGREKEPTYRGKVISVGNGAMTDNGERIPVNVSAGDRVIYSAFAGSPVYDKETNTTYIILNERDVLAVFTEDSGVIYTEREVKSAVIKALDDLVVDEKAYHEDIANKVMEILKGGE